MKKKEVFRTGDRFQDNSFDINNTFSLEVYRPVWETRARLRSKLNNLLMDTVIGQFLVQKGFLTHPILKEKDRQIDHFLWLARSYAELGFSSENEILNQLNNEPDLRLQTMNSIENIMKLESLIEQYLEFKSVYYSYKNTESTATRIIDRLQVNEEVEDYRLIMEEIKSDIQDLLYCNLRNTIFKFIEKNQWSEIINFIYCSHLDPNLQQPLELFLSKISVNLFKNHQFRLAVFGLLTQLIASNQIDLQEKFSEFLIDHHFTAFSQEEQKGYTNVDFVECLLNNMHDNYIDNYFESIQYFVENEVIAKEVFQNSILFQIHILENALMVFNGKASLRKFQNYIKPLVLGIGLFSDNELSSANKFNLSQKYWELCLRHSYSTHHPIKYS